MVLALNSGLVLAGSTMWVSHTPSPGALDSFAHTGTWFPPPKSPTSFPSPHPSAHWPKVSSHCVIRAEKGESTPSAQLGKDTTHPLVHSSILVNLLNVPLTLTITLD
jgi:hypothetical protein